MTLARKLIVYCLCGVVVAAVSPLLPFVYAAAAGVILAGLALVDILYSGRRNSVPNAPPKRPHSMRERR